MRIDALFRYPVKSMLGEQIETTTVGERGLLGDRAYALIDQQTGKVASAKNPRRWGGLFEFRAAFVNEPRAESELPPVRITMPDGSSVDSDDRDIHRTLSTALGRPVRIETRPPGDPVMEVYSPVIQGFPDPQADTVGDAHIAVVAPGTFFDAAPLHVVTTATLARLRELAPDHAFPAPRFRPNVVVAVDAEPGFVENDWVGHTLTVGPDLQASVFLSAPRCVMTTLAQPGLPRDPGVLQTVARHNRFDIPGLGPSACVGVYALVTAGGAARRGDPVGIS